MGRVRRWLHRIAWLLKSLFLNLTPARRVLLALALLLLCVRAQWRGDGQSLQFEFGGVPVGLLLLLLMLELKDKLVATSELQAGRVVQQALLPKEAPQVAGWDLWISTRPANEVGGDLVDVVTHEDGRVGLVLADVSSKGLPAALLMARLQATLLAFVLELPSLAALASKLHKVFPQAGPGEQIRDARLSGTRAGIVAGPPGERGAHASAGRAATTLRSRNPGPALRCETPDGALHPDPDWPSRRLIPFTVGVRTARFWLRPERQEPELMKKQLSALSLLLLSFTARQASPEDMKTEECRIKLPGITFTRSLNQAAAHAKVEDGRITLASEARRDNFRDPDGKLSNNTAPLLLTEVDNRQPFTLTAKVTPTFLKTYDAGTLYIYVKEDLWLKMAMEMDERQKTRMVSVRTIGTSDDNNHDVIEAKSVHMKISSDTKTVGFYYSLDKKSWQLIRLFKNDYPASIWVGISTQCPLGEGTSAVFEDLSLTKQSISDFRLGV